MKYMVGEEFFKNTDSSDDLNDADDDLEQIPYQVIKKERVRKCYRSNKYILSIVFRPMNNATTLLPPMFAIKQKILFLWLPIRLSI